MTIENESVELQTMSSAFISSGIVEQETKRRHSTRFERLEVTALSSIELC